MATVNLGKIKLKWRGSWQSNASPAYSIDDVVEHTDGSVTSSYIAVAASSNQAPSTGGTVNTTYWNLLAKGQAVSPTTTQGDIIVRGASADGRLAIGSAGQVLKVNSGANGLEYGVVDSTALKDGSGNVIVQASASAVSVTAGKHLNPATTNTTDLGTSSLRWRNLYTQDLQLSNESTGGNNVDGTWGNWTLQEGENDIFMINNRNGKKYKINLTEV